MRFIKCLVLACGLLAPAAHAQLRSIPPEAKPATLRHLQEMIVELNGKPARLSPGAQIRDPSNRLVLPASITEKATVRYLPDAAGMVHRVWLLSPEEIARLPKTLPASAGKKDDAKDDQKAKD